MSPTRSGPAANPGASVPTGVIGMVHLQPLPGAPDWAGSMEAVLDRARRDASALHEGGVNALLVENYGDLPFHKTVAAETVAGMTAAVLAVRAATDRPVGVNVLRNHAAAALAVAAATGARFIRVNIHTGGMFTDQGWIEGCAADTVRLRGRIAPDVAILADVQVKHALPIPGTTVGGAARDAVERGRADAVIVSGPATGEPTSLQDVRAAAAAVPGTPVLVGSGVTEETVRATLDIAAGVIVGSSLEVGQVAGGPVDIERVRRLVAAAQP